VGAGLREVAGKELLIAELIIGGDKEEKTREHPVATGNMPNRGGTGLFLFVTTPHRPFLQKWGKKV